MRKILGRGFTLLELMIVAGILLIAILGLLATFINCMFLNESNKNLTIAVNDAQYALEQIKSIAFNQISNFINNFNPTQFSNLNNETITFPSPSYGAKISEITVNVSWKERNEPNPRNFQLSTRIAL
jgi:type II secretory pathway pseudopilin PulG